MKYNTSSELSINMSILKIDLILKHTSIKTVISTVCSLKFYRLPVIKVLPKKRTSKNYRPGVRI